MMTATFPALFPEKSHPQWNVLLAEEPNKDLEFDEGLEEDDLDRSKPPSRKPLLWIVLLILAVGIAYWSLKPDTTFNPQGKAMDSAETFTPADAPKLDNMIPSPIFTESQKVSLVGGTGETPLVLDPQTGKPGPVIKPGAPMTILDGTLQDGKWMYQVKTQTGQIGWLSESKLQKAS